MIEPGLADLLDRGVVGGELRAVVLHKHRTGWVQFVGQIQALVGILCQSAGPSRVIRANPVRQ